MRYILGSLDGFTQEERLTDEASFPGLERWMRHRMAELDDVVRSSFAANDYSRAMHALMNFCSVDLSSVYFDIRKDTLYCDRPDDLRRRACRTVLDELYHRLTAWLAPVLSFTCEEAWLLRNPSDDGSVHLRQLPDTPSAWLDAERAERWSRLRKVRSVVLGALEIERREKRIGSALEAAPVVYLASDDDRAALAVEAQTEGRTVEEFLADLCITSEAVLEAGDGPPDAFRLDNEPGIAVTPAKAQGRRCARSWKVLGDVGSDERYPDLSARDADAVAVWDAAHDQ